VLEVDLARRRISLSMKRNPESGAARPRRGKSEEGDCRPRQSVPHPQSTPRGPATDWFTLALNKAAQAKARGKPHDEE